MSKVTSIFKFNNTKNAKISILTNNIEADYLSKLSATDSILYATDREDAVEGVYITRGQFRNTLEYDLIIIGNRFDESAHPIRQLAQRQGIPLLIVDSMFPWNFSASFSSIEDIPKRFHPILKQSSGDLHVSCSEEIGEAWSHFGSNSITVPYNNSNYDEEKFVEEWNNILKEFKEQI